MLQDNWSNFNLLFVYFKLYFTEKKIIFHESLENIVFRFWIITPRFNVMPIQGSPTLGTIGFKHKIIDLKKYICVDAFAFLYFNALFICRNILQIVSYHPKWGTIWHRIQSQQFLSDFSNDVYYQDFFFFFLKNW